VNEKRKLNRHPPQFRMLSQCMFGFRTRKCMVTDNQSDINRQIMPNRHLFGFKVCKRKYENVSCNVNRPRNRFEKSNRRLFGFKPHVKFRKLNQPNVRLRFRISELKVMFESGNVINLTRR